MIQLLHRRPAGWLALGLVAGLFVGSACFGLVTALVRGHDVTAFWRCVEIAFWWAVSVGALRRTHEPATAG